jgi:very-short-patch-repair endonuclease
MAIDLPYPCRQLIELQCGVLARWQAPAVGLGTNTIKTLLQGGRWQQMYLGVYAAHTGDPSWDARLWAAVLRAGPQAVLSHHSAADLDGLAVTPSTLIHVTVPAEQHLCRIPGVRIHRSSRLHLTRHPSRTPPRTRIEETVIDLTQTARTFDAAFGALCQACGSRLTTAARLRASMDGRRKVRWRAELRDAQRDIADGTHSMLEVRYVRDVERPHALPRERRQAAVSRPARRIYLDNLMEQFGVCVELDGQAAHPGAQRWRDIRRDNALAADGIVTLRYGWPDVVQRPCEVAAQIAAVLRQRGWTGSPAPCRSGCSAGPR